MNLIDLSIKRPVFAWILMSALIIFGAIGLSRLGVSQMPDVDFPVLDISLTYEGASPEVVEAELVDPIEERLLSVEGLKEMRSTVRQGGGSIRLDFDINRNVDVALQEVQSALSQIRLPAEIDPPVIRKSNPEEEPILFIGVWADRPLREVVKWADNYLLDQLRFLPQVGEVSIAGFSQRNLRIWPNLEKLKEYQLTLSDILDTIQSQHRDAAAGEFTEEKRELRVRWIGEGYSVQDIENLPIIRRGGQIIHERYYKIKDVARVEDGLSDIRRIARVEGKEAITISVRKQRGSNEVKVADAVLAKVEEIKSNLPKGFNVRVNIDFTKPTRATVDTTISKLWMAGLVTILVCFLFLGSWQSAINILFSIPTSIVGTFLILYFSGFTLNLFTLLALTLAISIVVDDAIMLLENIVRHFHMGKTPTQAASDGAKEILPAAIAATFALVAVFLPVVFMDGIIGKFFYQFGIAMSAAVLLSLLEAVTITPMRAAALMGKETKISNFERKLDHLFEGLAARYQRLLKLTLAWPKTVVLASLAAFALSLYLAKLVKQEFVPQQDQDFIILTGQTPVGSSLDVTVDAASKIAKIVESQPEVKATFFSAGAGGPSASLNSFFMPIILKPLSERTAGHIDFMNRLRGELKAVKGVRTNMRDISSRSLTSGRLFPVSFNLRGPSLDVLKEKSEIIMKRMTDEGLAQDLDTDYKTGLPELKIEPNRAAMALHGVSVETVASVLATVGGVRIGRYTSDGRRYDIRMKLPENEIKTHADVEKLFVRNLSGNLVPLSRLVTLSEQSVVQSITRVNRQRAIAVFGALGKDQSQAQVLKRAQEIAKEVLPEGYAFALEGASAGFLEAFKSLGFALIIGLIVAYMILAVQYNSFVHPISVLMALPFSISGALAALYFADVSLNLFSFIGIIVLMGIAKKNSILLVDFTNQTRAKGASSVREALEKACPVRLRPILMTSVATIAAAVPLLIGSGFGSETRVPMGLTIAGGTLVSTVLTLFVVPAIYLVLSRLERGSSQQP